MEWIIETFQAQPLIFGIALLLLFLFLLSSLKWIFKMAITCAAFATVAWVYFSN